MNIKTTAVKAAKKAGEVLAELSKKGVKYDMKNRYDILSEADLKSEGIILQQIRQDFPDHSILSEEQGEIIRNSDYCWIIDPLDGTINFAKGIIEEYCLSIAVEYKGDLALGLVYQPHLGNLYLAEKGKGAFLNEVKLSVSDEKNIIGMLLLMDNTSNIPVRTKALNLLANICGKVRDIRIFGSGALELARIASGNSDIYLRIENPHYWDYAAGALLVREAGGIATDLEGEDYMRSSKSFLASNGKRHQEILVMLDGGLDALRN